MKIKNIIPLLILSIIIPFRIFAANFYTLKTDVLTLEYDKLTSGYSVFYNNERVISSGYPASSFMVIEVDGAEAILPYEISILSAEYKKNSVHTLYQFKDILIKQVLEAEDNMLILRYHIEAENPYPHSIQSIIVFDIAPGIEQIEKGPVTSIKIRSIPDALIFIPSEEVQKEAQSGQYEDFRELSWGKNEAGKMNALAFFTLKKSIKQDESLDFFILIKTEKTGPVDMELFKKKLQDKPVIIKKEKEITAPLVKQTATNEIKIPEPEKIKIDDTKPVPADITEDDLDFFDDKMEEKEKPQQETEKKEEPKATKEHEEKKKQEVKPEVKPKPAKKEEVIKEEKPTEEQKKEPEKKEEKKEPDKKEEKKKEKADDSKNTDKNSDDFFDDIIE
ncbi:MAG: hypothetical protein KKH98_15650 [Spirochaetes bacterium]|nr:hypothetical protein [Spirochaetota bacterium]